MSYPTDAGDLAQELLVIAFAVLQHLHRNLTSVMEVALVNITTAAMAQLVSIRFCHPLNL
jgi:hypothetical protein